MAANFFKTDGRSIIPKDWGDYGHILQHGMILPHSHPQRSMIGAYGDGGCFPHYEAQTLSDHPKPATDYHLKTGQRK